MKKNRRKRNLNQRIDIKMYSSLIFLYDNMLTWLPILLIVFYVSGSGYLDCFFPKKLIYYQYPNFYPPFLIFYALSAYWLWYILFAPGFEYEDEDIKPTTPENIRHHEMTKMIKRKQEESKEKEANEEKPHGKN